MTAARNKRSPVGIILAAYGTTNQASAKETIMPFYRILKRRFPRREVRLAYTSRKIVDKLWKRGIDQPTEIDCLLDLLEEGIQKFYIQPLFITYGQELTALHERIKAFQKRYPGLEIKVGPPLLTAESLQDHVLLRALAIHQLANIDMGDTAGSHCVYVAHGGSSDAEAMYGLLEERLSYHLMETVTVTSLDRCAKDDWSWLAKGTVKGKEIEEQEDQKEQKEQKEQKGQDGQGGHNEKKRIHLFPLFFTLGYHPKKDILGPLPHSVKSRLEAMGYQVIPHPVGIGLSEYVQEAWEEFVVENIKIFLD